MNTNMIGCNNLKSFSQELNVLRECSYFVIADCPQLDASISNTLNLPLSCKVITGKYSIFCVLLSLYDIHYS